MPLTYTITLNEVDDGAPRDLTADVRAVRWRLGAEQPDQALAPPGFAHITLDNSSGRYLPDSAARIGRWLTIRCHDGITDRVHFSGPVVSVTPGTDPDDANIALLEAITADAGLAALTTRLPPMSDVAPGPLAAALLTDLPLRRPSLHLVWALDAPDFGTLGVATRLGDPLALPVEADTGIARFALAALGGLPSDEALRQIVTGEGGRCWLGRDGTLVFEDRHHTLRALGTAAEFDGSMLALEWADGDWANRVQIRFTPVSVGDPDRLLWSLAKPQRLPPGVHRVRVRYADATGQVLVAWSVTQLVASATHNADGSGGAALLEALIVGWDAREALLEFRNPGAQDAWLTTDTRLEGTPLRISSLLTVEQSDMLSVSLYGPRLHAHDLPLLDSLDEADGRARFELLLAPRPARHVRWIELDARAVPSALALTMGDRIRVREPVTGHDAGYHVIGETHTVDEGGARHRLRLVLEPASVTRFWEIGLCALDNATALAY